MCTYQYFAIQYWYSYQHTSYCTVKVCQLHLQFGQMQLQSYRHKVRSVGVFVPTHTQDGTSVHVARLHLYVWHQAEPSAERVGDRRWQKLNKVISICCALSTAAPSHAARLPPSLLRHQTNTRSPLAPIAPNPPLHSDAAHLPRACPFQQRSSLVTSAAVFSSLQMVCGRDTQKPRMGLSRSFSSVTCAEADKKLVVTQTLLL